MAKTKTKRAKSAGSSKGPAASRSTKGKTTKSQAKGKAAAKAAADVVAKIDGQQERLSPMDVPMGKGKIASVRFDTPKGKALRKSIEKWAKDQPSMRAALFQLAKTGLEAESGKNLFKKAATVEDIDLRAAIDSWAAKKWKLDEDRPAFKSLLYTLLAAGLAVTTHKSLEEVAGVAAPAKAKRIPKAKKTPAARDKSIQGEPGVETELEGAKRRTKAARKNYKHTSTKTGPLHVTREGDQGEAADDVPTIDANDEDDPAHPLDETHDE